MSIPPPEDIAARRLREAGEELCAAEVIAEHAEVPDRVAGFHVHLGRRRRSSPSSFCGVSRYHAVTTWSVSGAFCPRKIRTASTRKISSC